MARAAGQWRKVSRAMAVAVWVAASVGIWVSLHCYFRRASMEKAEERLVSMCEERARMLQDQFAVSVNHVHALAVLISIFHYDKHPSAIDQDTFARYTARTAFERPLLNGVAYAQRVLHGERELFEKTQGWVIKTMKQEISPRQDEYAPVIFSQETVSYIGAIDMLSGEEDRENILRSRATGKALLTYPFKLLESNHLGVVLTLPVYRPSLPAGATVQERVDATVGYLGGAFDVESLVENLLRQLAGNQDIVVHVFDVTNASEPMIMYGPPLPSGKVSLMHVSVLDFGDPFRRHEMKCRYRIKPPIPWSVITTPSGVFVICMLVGYIFYAAWSRYDNVKEDCRKMTVLKLQAEAADVAKSQFLATVSHEIRTPMNGVLGMLEMLMNTELNLTQKDYTQTAQVCGRALITLINDVLDRAKIESGKLELEAVPFDVRSVLDNVISMFSSKSREKGIELAAFVADQVPDAVIGDPGRFRQILTNLVGNSVKFTERGHIFVRVCLVETANAVMNMQANVPLNQENENSESSYPNAHDTLSGFMAADERNTWSNFKLLLSDGALLLNSGDDHGIVSMLVTIEDTGVGIPFHAQDRVFTPFMQADSSTSRNYGGTGIGLSISKCLVELMGGQISFVSRPHIGSTFTFTANFKPLQEEAREELKRSPSEILPTSFNRMRAVLVDGRHVRRAVTAYHLRRLGIVVDMADDVTMAMQALKCGMQHRAVFVETELWKSDEESVAQLKRSSCPKLVLLTASDSDGQAARALFDNVVMKPIRASTLATCLQHVFESDYPQRKETSTGSSSLQGLLSGKSVLVVDDNKVNLRVAAAALGKLGAKVTCVESGKEAVSLLRPPHSFDACFMDVQMPEMDGFEATRLIRLQEEAASDVVRRLPILAMTADVIQATLEECIKSGMDGYVSKPFDYDQLHRVVSGLLAQQPL